MKVVPFLLSSLLVLICSCSQAQPPLATPSPAAVIPATLIPSEAVPTETPGYTETPILTHTPHPSSSPVPTSTWTPQATPIFGPRLDAVFSPKGSVPFGQRAFSPDGLLFAREVEPKNTGRIGIFQRKSDRLSRTIDASDVQNNLKGLAWSPDSNRLAVMFHYGNGGAVIVYEAQTGRQLALVPINEYYHFMVFASDGTQIIASLTDSNSSAEWMDLGPTNPACDVSATAPPSSPKDRFQKGMNFSSWSAGDLCSTSSDESLAILGATGANSVAFVVTGYQERASSTSTNWTYSRTPSDGDIMHAVATAHKLGMRVMLKPHVDLLSDPKHWRGQIGEAFTNDKQWSEWFSSYRSAILHYAELALSQGVEQFCVGTELSSLSTRDSDWRELVRQVRLRFKGQIVYASNWGEERNIGWWDAVDLIGVDAYYPLVDKVNPSVDELEAAWMQKGYVSLLQNLSQRYHKPILFTEIGYRSTDRASESPWDYESSRSVNLQEQANAYQAAITTFKDKPWFAGFYWWNWQANTEQGGPNDSGYTPFGKPAQQILSDLYHSTWP